MQCKYQIDTAQAGEANRLRRVILPLALHGRDVAVDPRVYARPRGIFEKKTDSSLPRNEAAEDNRNIRGNETILIVEDEEAVRNLTVRMLQTLGYRTIQAEHGREALEICRTFAEPIHLVLTDMIMPHMGGRQLVAELRKMRRNYKVLFVSGYGCDDMVDGKIIGTDMPLLQKPFTRETLGRKIREMLNS